METIQIILRDWNKSTSERTKLQQAYVLLGIIAVIVAGLTTLLNPELGHSIVIIGGFLFLAFLSNAVLWALLKSFIVDRLNTKKPYQK